MFDGELSFALKLAREMGRPDWRAMLAGMSSTEYADWHRFYSTHYFHDVLLDMHFSGLTYTVLSLFFSDPDIRQETLNECTRAEQSASVVLWEIDLTEVGGERYFFCNEQNEKGEPVTWQGRQYQPYPIQGSGFELNGKGTSTRPTLTVSNLYGMVTGMAEDLQSLVGGTVVRRKVYARFLDAVNFVNGNSDADPEQEVISRWRIEQCSELSAVSASFVLSTPTETDGAVFPGRIMLANTCTWTYRGDECGYHGPAVADEYDQPTSDITKDKCSKCLSGCKFRNNVGNFGGFLSINKLSQ